ncbi:FAD-dependent oxidoreductase [Streptomyces syringium]|uniref:FAD-dependent oxidoreductase n=1 Tax=Streptomyces syringium TaxID=76729 RepID=UPI003456D16C
MIPIDTAATPTTAVVLGAGIAGLAMSRILADFLDSVIVIERHPLPADERARGGVPQAHHIHDLTTRGLGHLDEVFPGLDHELASAGSPLLDHGRDVHTCLPAGVAPRIGTGLQARLGSRALLEARIRDRVLGLPNVVLRTGQRVTGLVTDAMKTAIRAVIIGGERILPGDLIIDATGRFSRLPRWLAEAGFPTLPSRTIEAGFGYASCLLEAPGQPWLGLLHPTICPGRTRGAYIGKIEGHRWMVTLVGACGDHPPADADGFREFAHSLGNPEMTAFLQQAQPASRIRRYTRTENRRIDYHRMRTWPDRLLVTGDAVCAFNPVYGQGIDSALEQALLLRSLLSSRTDLTGLARDFQRRLPRTTTYAWHMSTFQDAMWARHRTARTTLSDRAISWYLHRLYRAAVQDPKTMEKFLQVFHRTKLPTTLLSPHVLAQICRRRLPATRAHVLEQDP